MLNTSTKNVILGNIQLLNYCERQRINVAKLHNCNIERMDNKYFFVILHSRVT